MAFVYTRFRIAFSSSFEKMSESENESLRSAKLFYLTKSFVSLIFGLDYEFEVSPSRSRADKTLFVMRLRSVDHPSSDGSPIVGT